MEIYPAELADVNACYQMDMSYTTDYVWQMQTRESGRMTEVRFDTVRLPRSMRVAYPRSPDELLEHWQRNDCFLVARNLDNEIAGFLDAQAHIWLDLLWISNLVVHQPHRQQRFGTRLLEAATHWALEHNLHQITLEVQTKNYPAICFAQKQGFQYCGYNERYYQNGDIALFFFRSI